MKLDRNRDDAEGGFLGACLSFLRNIGWGARDAVGFTVGAVGSVAVLVNALFLQSGPHPAPLFKAPPAPVAAGEATNTVAVAVPRARPAEAMPAKGEVPRTATASAALPVAGAGRNDVIGDMLSSSRRVVALQRALAQYGYGQIRPTGIIDAETRAAIEKFERELAGLTGRPLD
jgi:hypothetical protein